MWGEDPDAPVPKYYNSDDDAVVHDAEASTAMAWLTEWCWEPLLDMHPEDKVATHDILVFADENGICAEVIKALKTEWPGGDPDDMGFGTQGFDGRLSLKSTPRRIIERRY